MNPKLSICALAAVASLSIVGGACGGDDDDETTAALPTTTAGTTGPTGPTGQQGATGTVTADDVVACLDEAGLDASTSDSEFLGLEGDYERVDIAQGDLDTAATMAIFGSEDEAADQLQAADVALGVADVKQSGNVDWGIDAAAEFSPDEEKAIEGCLPS